jgi:hypothetical protein
MSLLGRFTIDVQFQEASAATAVSSMKTVALQHSTEYDFGKIAVVTGTVGTAVINVDCNAPAYTDSTGDAVTFSSISRVAFSATGSTIVRCASDQLDTVGYSMTLYSRSNQIAVSECIEDNEFEIGVNGTAGTATYTLVLYGS